MVTSSTSSSMPTIVLTVFIDLLGFGIIIPILAPLLLDPGDMLAGMEEENRNLVYGYLIGSYSISQFFFAPFIGALSDRYGRKSILFISLIAGLSGYLIFAYGIYTQDLILLFVGRCTSGIASGNLAIIYSAIADISEPEEKAKNFGLVGMAFGIGFIFGPLLGGVLSDKEIISWFNFTTPFLFAALLVVCNLLLVFTSFPETLKHPNKNARLSLLSSVRDLGKAMSNQQLRAIFLVIFLINFGFTFFTQFIQPFLIKKFGFDQSDIGFLFGFVGIFIAITQGLIVRYVSKFYGPVPVVALSTFMLGVVFLLILVPETTLGLYLIMPGVALAQGLANPNLYAIVSNSVPKHLQGETLGMQQSVTSIAQFVPPIIGGYVLSIQFTFPIWLAAATTLLASLAFIIQFGWKDLKA